MSAKTPKKISQQKYKIFFCQNDGSRNNFNLFLQPVRFFVQKKEKSKSAINWKYSIDQNSNQVKDVKL